jgi:hypothetical protein
MKEVLQGFGLLGPEGRKNLAPAGDRGFGSVVSAVPSGV